MVLSLALLLLAGSVSHTLALNATQWSQLTIYQVLTDRFALTNGSSVECWIRSYCGGTWKGLENKLDYIQGMGFDAVWISPVIHQIEGNTTYGYAFHGYWGNDPFTLNPHFGTAEDLKSLSDSLHARNMSLMVDIVINHLASNNTPDAVNYSDYPPPFNSELSFHPNCSINYANQSSIEDCWLVDSPPPTLPDINTENATVFDAMVSSVVEIVRKYDVDGIRLDTARHVPKSYLAQFQKAVGVFVTGEALNDSVAYVSQYQGPLDSAINYPLWYVLVDTFVGRTTFDYLAATIKTEEAAFSNVNALTNFLDNHDQPRMASRLGDDIVRDMNAVTFLLFTSGIPMVYYGWEQRFNGSGDPVNREPMWTSDYDTQAPLYQFIAKLHNIRAHAGSVAPGGKEAYFASKSKILSTSAEYMAFQRGPVVIVVSNIGGSQDAGQEAIYSTLSGIMVEVSSFTAGTKAVDLLSCDVVTVSSQGAFESMSNNGSARVWIEESRKGSFC